MDASAPSPEGRHEPVWTATSDRTDYDPLGGDRSVDTAVVGGGIAGITTAAKLDEAGQTVALLERDRILGGATGHTTAKVTSLHGLVYDELLGSFGEEQARQYATANQRAIEDIADTVERRDIDCGFGRAPAYTYVAPDGDRSQLRAEVNAARRLGLPAAYAESTELPYDVGAAIRLDDQAYFHPRQYLLELARGVDEGESHVFEGTTVEGVEDGTPCRVSTDRATVRADDVVVASHFPVADDALYFSRMRPKRSYVVAARLAGDPPDGLYYRSGESQFSVRPHATDESLVLLGGQNHRTGDGDSTAARYRRLERRARERFDIESIEYRWATQDYVSVDGVPFVGTAAPHLSNVYVATGFGGWGMTNGTAAGRLLADEILGRAPDWGAVFDPNRFKPRASASELLAHNKHTMRHYAEDYLGHTPSLDGADLDPGEAGVYEADDDPVAVYRDEDGEVHVRSAVCPHMGCLVSWNDGEQSWDCPCHGSRFGVDGDVLDTPAVQRLDDASLGTDPDF